MAIEDVLIELGVELDGGSEREIRALCPVHELVKGRPDTRPSWYMNRVTGAWICFSCKQGGSLRYLVELLGGDTELLREVQVEAMVHTIEEVRARRVVDFDEIEPDVPEVYISEYGFAKNPLPPKSERRARDLRGVVCTEYNVRWDKTGWCYLIPLYDVRTHALIGWQEKSGSYVHNVPDGVNKSACLFGYQQYRSGDLLVVESPLDVVRLAGYDIRAVATLGSYVSDVQIEALINAVPDDGVVILAFDNDEAGIPATKYVYDKLRWRRARSIVRVFEYPARRFGKDPGDLPIEMVHAGIASAHVGLL